MRAWLITMWALTAFAAFMALFVLARPAGAQPSASMGQGMQITTELVTFLIAVIVVVAGAWWRVESAVKSAKSDVQETIREAKTEIDKDIDKAAGRADAAGAMVNLLSTQLAEHKLHIAETYITKAGLREFRDEVMTGVRDLKGSVATLHERMDRFIEPQARRTKPPER